MFKFVRKYWSDSSFTSGPFQFDRPLILLESDDWGRVGVRDREGWEELRAAGVSLGEHPYDYYSLETAADVTALHELLTSHQDSAGQSASMVLNFVTGNIDFEKLRPSNNNCEIPIRPLSDGLPGTWARPGLFEAFQAGIRAEVFVPALHGWTHFCVAAAKKELNRVGPRAALLRTLWSAQTPYIHWRMPWIGFEYACPVPRGERFLAETAQSASVYRAVDTLNHLFGGPITACAPGYRMNQDTYRCWRQHGMKVVQHGSGQAAPYFSDALLHLHRSVDFEPAIDGPGFNLEECLEQAECVLAQGIPLVISVHSINFHSTLKNFRDRTLRELDVLLSTLELRYPRLLYANDRELLRIIEKGRCERSGGGMKISVSQSAAPAKTPDAAVAGF